MCFSATASFVPAGLTGSIGIVTVEPERQELKEHINHG